ncbi:hypothetical protein GH5_08522 [Leishmania sp. Ghana 2012 LV757]|uniref:hypothetical protein n=1 Tax=Leishmania sp. Ghana 2012 LV757 TaxID=2803181 RepID=UPI001B5B57AF|nr:hypothetical protein GH5_08522 [Leishmania sp. Ghana 2012 LV757]
MPSSSTSTTNAPSDAKALIAPTTPPLSSSPSPKPSASSVTAAAHVETPTTASSAAPAGSAEVASTTAAPSEPNTASPTGNDSAESEPRQRDCEPVTDGRFRIALRHRYDDSDGCSGAAPSAVMDTASELRGSVGASELCERACRTLESNALYNHCRPSEPRIEVSVEASLVNAINSAYTSTGYPFVVTTGNSRGAVYGSFVDLHNPSLSSLELPPPQTIIVAPSDVGGADGLPAHGLTEMDTLLAIHWSRGDRIMTTAGMAVLAAAASQGKGGGASGPSSSTNASAAAHAKQTPPMAAAGAAGGPHSPMVARTIAHHLVQYPEGIHGVHSSPALRQILVEGTLPTVLASAPSAAVNAAARAPASGSGGVGSSSTAATATSVASSSQVPQSSNAEANVPPLPTPPQSNAPVQHTLVSASTFNHVSVYLVAHQDGKLLYTAPIQSLSVSIATRKVTAHQLILVGREEVDALVADPFTPRTVMPPKRTRITFADVPVGGEEAAVFFDSTTLRFVGADEHAKTISAAPIRFTVEPHLLIGNQNGDIFVFALLQERVVQHINYSTGRPSVGASVASSSSGGGMGSKVICSPVSCIAEVQNGIEKKITRMVEYAATAKRNRRPTFDSDDTPSGFTAAADAAAPSHYYYDVPPSLYAIGFDNGQVLLVCVTCEGGWMLRQFGSHYFGVRPIHSIAVRVPPFFARLWTGVLPPITPASHSSSASAVPLAPITTLVTAETALIVHEEEQRIAAISCNDGVIALVRLPGMEIISSVAPTDYNAVGELLALQWTATSPCHLLTPDILVASGEDDTMTAFQLLAQFPVSIAECSHHNGPDSVSHISSAESTLASGRLRILEKKRFHRSWVSRLHLMPVVVPAAVANAKGASRSSRGGMPPQCLGMCLIASSYDHRTSFWPYMFSGWQQELEAADAPDSANTAASAGTARDAAHSLVRLDSIVMSFSGSGAPLGTVAAPVRYVLVDGPTAAYQLHPELVLSVAAAGGGRSFFLTTVCCRGKVKFWSMQVKV